MKKIIAMFIVTLGLAAASGIAAAHDRVSIGLSFGLPAPVYVAPAPPPYYYDYAPPAYYVPSVVYYSPRPWPYYAGTYRPPHHGWRAHHHH